LRRLCGAREQQETGWSQKRKVGHPKWSYRHFPKGKGVLHFSGMLECGNSVQKRYTPSLQNLGV
jgi:hypothetical protein